MIDDYPDNIYRYMLRTTFVTFLALLLSASSIMAQTEAIKPGVKVNLQTAIETALANSTDMKRALLSVRDADQLENLAWAEVMPTINADMTYTRNMEIPVNFVPGEFFGGEPGSLVPIAFGTDNSWDGGLSIQQTLFRGQAFIGISSSSVFRMAQLENYRAASQFVVTQTRQAYHTVLIAKEQLRLQEAAISRLRENLSDNKSRAGAGIIDEYEVLRVEVQLRNEEPRIQQSLNSVNAAYRNLKVLMGMPLDVDFEIEGDLSAFDIFSSEASPSNASISSVSNQTPYQPLVRAGEVPNLGQTRGDLRILDYQIQLKKKEISSEKSMYYPNITATYNLRWSAAQPGSPNFFGDSDSRARFQTLGVKASLPIFDGMRRNTNVQRAIISRKDLEEQLSLAERQARNEVITASEEINQVVTVLPSVKEGIDLARTGYDRALARFNNGLGTQLDVTEAELQLRQAQLNYAQLIFDYLNSKAKYDQAIGRVPFVSN
jgi:outer membrane protein